MTTRALLLAALLAQPAAAAPAPAPAFPVRLEIPGVPNAAQVSPVLWRGGQPSAEGFRELSRRGVKSVLSMREGHDDASLLPAGLGLTAFRIPSVQWRAETQVVASALKVITTAEHQPVFVHCKAGKDRTGLVVAAYEVLYQGASVDAALAERRAFGAWRIWRANDDFLERLKLPKVREDLLAMIESAPPAAPVLLPPQ